MVNITVVKLRKRHINDNLVIGDYGGDKRAIYIYIIFITITITKQMDDEAP